MSGHGIASGVPHDRGPPFLGAQDADILESDVGAGIRAAEPGLSPETVILKGQLPYVGPWIRL